MWRVIETVPLTYSFLREAQSRLLSPQFRRFVPAAQLAIAELSSPAAIGLARKGAAVYSWFRLGKMPTANLRSQFH
jgi:hypothetical protein